MDNWQVSKPHSGPRWLHACKLPDKRLQDFVQGAVEELVRCLQGVAGKVYLKRCREPLRGEESGGLVLISIKHCEL